MDMKKPPAPKLPRPKMDPGNKMADIARKSASLSKKDMKDQKTATDDAGKKGPKPIPRANAKKWHEKIKRSEKIRKPFMEEADRYMRMYQGDYSLKPSKKRNLDAMSVNMVYAYVETAAPAIFSGFPEIRVRPKPKVGEDSSSMEDRARNMELVINYWLKELSVDEELKDVLLDSFFGLAAVEVGWETEVIDDVPEILDEEGDEIDGQEVQTIIDRPFITRRDRKYIYLDPDAPRRRDGRWMVVEEVITYNDFISSSLYTKRAKKMVKPQMYPKSEEEKGITDREADSSDKEWVQLFTIWDKDAHKKIVISKGYDGFVNTDDPEGEEWPYEMEYKGDPFPICIHDAKRDYASPYTWSEFKAVEPQIQEVNRLRSAMQVHVKRTLPKYIYTEDVGTKADINKLMNARSDEATKLENLNAIKPLDLAQIPSDLYKFSEMARDDYTNTSGMQEFQQEALAKTATEANIMQGNSDVRKSMRSRYWEQFVVEIAAKIAQLCQQNMDSSIAIKIAGAQGIDWLQVNKEQIQGEFWYDMEPGIMEYKNEGIRKQQLLKFLELSANNPMANQRNILSKVAQELDLDPNDVILPQSAMPAPPPPPPMLKMKELDPLSLDDSGLMNMVVAQYLQQNGVQLSPQMLQKLGAVPPGPPQPPPGTPAAQKPAPTSKMGSGGAPPTSGKDISDKGMNPNGNPHLPPVSGNLHPGGEGK
jgi:hypothetical protein